MGMGGGRICCTPTAEPRRLSLVNLAQEAAARLYPCAEPDTAAVQDRRAFTPAGATRAPSHQSHETVCPRLEIISGGRYSGVPHSVYVRSLICFAKPMSMSFR